MSLTRLEIMKQKSLGDLLVRLVENSPGITTTKLWSTASDWAGGKLTAYDFDRAVDDFRNKGYRVTNKQWYPQNHAAPQKPSNPKAPDPRQTRWAF